MQAMSPFGTALDLVRRVLVRVGDAAVVAIVALVTIEVVLRPFDLSLSIGFELVVKYLMPMLAFLPLAEVERRGNMVSVEMITTLAGEVTQRAALMAAGLVTIIVYLALAWTTLLEALRLYRVGSYVVTMDIALPTWPAYFVLPLGFLAGALAVAQRLIEPPLPDVPGDEA